MAILLEKKDPPHPEAGRSLSKTPSNTKTERGILEKFLNRALVAGFVLFGPPFHGD